MLSPYLMSSRINGCVCDPVVQWAQLSALGFCLTPSFFTLPCTDQGNCSTWAPVYCRFSLFFAEEHRLPAAQKFNHCLSALSPNEKWLVGCERWIADEFTGCSISQGLFPAQFFPVFIFPSENGKALFITRSDTIRSKCHHWNTCGIIRNN